MGVFKSTEINLGTVVVGSKNLMEFPYGDEVNYISTIETPCGCSTGKNDPIGRKVIVEYTAQPIPIHLEIEGRASQDKDFQMEVSYIDMENTKQYEKLRFKAVVIKS